MVAGLPATGSRRPVAAELRPPLSCAPADRHPAPISPAGRASAPSEPRQPSPPLPANAASRESPAGHVALLDEQIQAPPPRVAEPDARFLPRYDNYLLAYDSRDFVVEPAFAKRVHPGGGLIRACVISDGRAVANWKLEQRRKSARIVVSPFQALDKPLLPLFWKLKRKD